MHKMELGDSVYAAERIMKKRIRRVSFYLIHEISASLAILVLNITFSLNFALVFIA
jgi:hypothetical protein